MTKSPKSTLFIGILLVMVTVVFGCSTYQNVTSYFNTYYNAQKLFDDAVIDLSKAPRPGSDTLFFPLPSIKTQSGSQAKFDKVIEKCSKLIQYYPESGLVDDAILLIGKSGVYIGENELAIRKFGELFQNFPESELLGEARLWNAKAFYFSNKQDEALKLIDGLLPDAIKNGEEDIILEAYLLVAQIYFVRGEYDVVIQNLDKAIERSGENSKLAFAQSQLARCSERVGDYEKAALAYERVLQYSTDFTTEFRARLQQGIMLYEADKPEHALEVFQNLNDEDLKPEDQALVDHEVANVYAMMGDSLKAFDLYLYVDTTYKKTDAAARSNYRRGLLMEELYGNFKKARDYYEKARTEFGNSAIAPLAKKRSDYLAKYFTLRNDVRKYDSLYLYLVNEDSIKEAEKKKAEADAKAKAKAVDSTKSDSSLVHSDSLSTLLDSSKNLAMNEEIIAPQQGEGEGMPEEGKEEMNNDKANPDEGNQGEVSKEETEPAAENNNEEAGKEEKKSDEGGDAEETEERRGEIPPLKIEDALQRPATQREREQEQNQAEEGDNQEGQIPKEGEGVGESEPLTDEQLENELSKEDSVLNNVESQPISPVAPPPGKPGENVGTLKGQTPDTGKSSNQKAQPVQNKPVQPQRGMTFDSLDNLRAKVYYELGTLFMLDMHRDDSAEYAFIKVASDFPGSRYVPRALYTLAEVYRSREDTCAMDSLYNMIFAEYKNTEYGTHLHTYFGENLDTIKSVDSVEAKYALINVFPDSANALSSIHQLDSLSMMYPESPVAAKALFAIGWIYENVVYDNDSAASVYKKLIEKYPASEYTVIAKPKVAVKENPESLGQYIHITEIQAVAKPAKQTRSKQDATKGGTTEDRENDSFQDRFKERNLDEETDEENTDAEPTDEETEDNENTDDGGEGDDDGGEPSDEEGNPPPQFQGIKK